MIKTYDSSKDRLTAIDLFCGAGGLTLGLEQSGFKVLAGVEIDETASVTYRMNHPHVLCMQEDIRSIAPDELMAALGLRCGELSLLAGCPPCQGFSTLRTRKKAIAVDDDRNDLLFEYLRFVKAFMPKALMMENVPALMKDVRMKRFLPSLADLGYDVYPDSVRIEDAARYGVPQRRRRMIMQILRDGRVPFPQVTEPITVREYFSRTNLNPVGQANDPLHDYLSKRTTKITELIKAIPKDGGSRFALPDHLVLPCHKRNPGGFVDVYGRMKWDDVAPTITGGCGNPSKGRYLHPEEDRAISLREAAILQTFPVDYKFSLNRGRGKVALMIGNALPPEFIKRHAQVIAEQLKNHK